MEDLRGRVQRLLGQAIELSGQAGENEFVTRLNDELDHLGEARGRTATIVVVGETNAGKSSLVNALLERPGLSPVDRRVATNAYIQFRWAEEESAFVHFEDSRTRAIALDEVAGWATEQHNPGNEQGVSSVDVGLAVTLLKDLTIIDSPGVGGLESKHKEIAMLAVRLADALLFVIDAKRELSESALRFLERAAERIDTVIIAVTKKDRYPSAREILAEDRRLLAEHAPRFAGAPIELVSSKDVEASLLEHNAEYAAELRATANIDRIVDLLRQHVSGRVLELSLLNSAMLAVSALTELELAFDRLLEAATAGPELGAELEAKREKLERERVDVGAWQRRLDLKLDDFKEAGVRELRDSLTVIESEYSQRTVEVRADGVEALFGALIEDLMSAALALRERTVDALPGVVSSVLGDVDVGAPLSQSLTEMMRPGGQLTVEMPTITAPKVTVSEWTQWLLTLVAPRSLLMTLQGLGLGIAAGPASLITLVGGGVYVTLSRRQRVKSAKLVQLQTGVRDAVARARVIVEEEYSSHLRALRAELYTAVGYEMARRVRAIDGLIVENDASQRSSDQQRQQRERQLEEGRTLAHNTLTNAPWLLEQLRATPTA